MSTAESLARPEEAGLAAVRDLVLVLADSKRLLGLRYAEWILGAPELEAGIACASMAQDEWGHARLLYALLKDFGDDVDHLEHGRDAAGYRCIALLDRAPDAWPGLVVLNALADTALTVQCEALRGSAFEPLAQRVGKLLEEERFHAAHGAAWLRRLARAGGAARDVVAADVARALPVLLAWFGPDSPAAAHLVDGGFADAAGSVLRERFLERVAPLLDEVGALPDAVALLPGFDGFDEAMRRTRTGGPDAETLARIRGDRNRVFLMD